mmetsp:Transcript_38844/g.98332  ORF Transcript_38844/g.98332 Transcript_38844/m.98332 type:complete len:231 (-) Transcript_38844:250-942(-)
MAPSRSASFSSAAFCAPRASAMRPSEASSLARRSSAACWAAAVAFSASALKASCDSCILRSASSLELAMALYCSTCPMAAAAASCAAASSWRRMTISVASCASCCAVASPPVRGAASLPPLEPAPPERASEAARSSAFFRLLVMTSTLPSATAARCSADAFSSRRLLTSASNLRLDSPDSLVRASRACAADAAAAFSVASTFWMSLHSAVILFTSAFRRSRSRMFSSSCC